MSKKLLVIEDDKDIQEVMLMILEDEGYELTFASDSSPLQNLLSLQPDLILMDNSLKDGYGHDFCRVLKQDRSLAHIPVVLVSAASELAEIAKGCLADGYLKKPFDVEELIAVAKRFC